MDTAPKDWSALCFKEDPRPYIEQVRDRLRKMTDQELISWGREAARLARTNPGSVTARDEARAEWRRFPILYNDFARLVSRHHFLSVLP
jgi:hypothetical protein